MTDAGAVGDDLESRPANRWPGRPPAADPAGPSPRSGAEDDSPPADPQPGWRPGWPAPTPAGPAAGIPGFTGGAGGPPGGPPVGPGPGGWPAHARPGDGPRAIVVDHRTRNAVLAGIGVVVVAAVVITLGVIATNQKPKPLPYARMSSYQEYRAVSNMCADGPVLHDGPAYRRGGVDQWAAIAGPGSSTDVFPLDRHRLDPNGTSPLFTKGLRLGMAVCVDPVEHLVTKQCEADVGFKKQYFPIDLSVGFALRLVEVRTGKVLRRTHFVVTEPQCPVVLRLTQAGKLVEPFSDDVIDDAQAQAQQLAHQYDSGH